MTWYEIEVAEKGVYRLSIRWWHPGFWFEAYETMRSAGAGVWESIVLTARLVRIIWKRKK